MLYMVTFTINIPQMLAYIPYMDPMGYQRVLLLIHGFFFGRGIALFHDLIGGRLQSEATLPCLPGPGTRGMGALMKR